MRPDSRVFWSAMRQTTSDYTVPPPGKHMTHHTPSRYACMALLALFSVFLGGCRERPVLVQYHESRPLMGTLVEITTEGEDRQRLIDGTNAAYAEMNRLSDMMNHYNPDSVVSAINRQAGIQPVAVPRELMHVLIRAAMMSERTGGAFDITVGSLRGWHFDPQKPGIPDAKEIAAALPLINYRNMVLNESAGTAYLAHKGMRIDLGGIAKLFILNAGLNTLKQNRVTHAMINGGGDVVVVGTIQGRSWRVGVRDPRDPDKLFTIVELQRGFVVSSGDYERYFMRDGRRYHHILDPANGYPTNGPRAVTLVSQDINLVNGMSSAIMVMGMERGRRLIEIQPSMEGIIFGQDQIWVSPLLEKRLVRPPAPAP